MDKKIYMVIFHVGRRVFNRYFSSREMAMSFAESLKDEPRVDLGKGIFVNEEMIDMEDAFIVPKGGRDPQPDAAEVIFAESGMTTRAMNLGGNEP